jgi:putative aminopeptidase FrvX
MTLPTIDINYFVAFLVDLLNIPSPTGFAEPAIDFVEKELSNTSNSNFHAHAKVRLLQNGRSKATCLPLL